MILNAKKNVFSSIFQSAKIIFSLLNEMRWNNSKLWIPITGHLWSGRFRRYRNSDENDCYNSSICIWFLVGFKSKVIRETFLRIRSAFCYIWLVCFFTWPSVFFPEFLHSIRTITINNTSNTKTPKWSAREEKKALNFNGVCMNTFGSFVSHFTVSYLCLNV